MEEEYVSIPNDDGRFGGKEFILEIMGWADLVGWVWALGSSSCVPGLKILPILLFFTQPRGLGH